MIPPSQAPTSAELARAGFLRLGAVGLEGLGAGLPTSPVRSIRDAYPAVWDWACRGPLSELASRELGPAAFPVRALLFAKPPGRPWFVPWHQDRVVCVRRRERASGFDGWSEKEGVPHANAPAAVLARMLTLRVHLDGARAGDGPLEVLPGTHHGVHAPERIARLAGEVTPVELTAEPGEVLAMRPLLVHRSRKSHSESPRRVLHVEYAAGALPDPLAWYHGPPEEGRAPTEPRPRPTC